jgi:uncharacterized protein involved in exopolysaccharide biosynthesis
MNLMVEPPRRAADQLTQISRRRRGRSLAILLVLVGLALLFYAITIVKMAHL